MKSLAKLIFAAAFIFALAYIGQSLVLFPGLWTSKQIRIWETPSAPPLRVERVLLTGEDNAVLDAWRLGPASGQGGSYVAIVFHNESGSLRSHFYLQKWLANLGMTSYAIDYRGFGTSSGWPDEASMYRDGLQLAKKAAAREQMEPSRLIVIGDSVGASIAASTAAEIGAKKLMLISPFTSYAAKLGIERIPYVGRLLSFSFPTAAELSKTSGACIILAGLERGGSARFISTLAEIVQPKNTVVKFVSATSTSVPELLRQFKEQLENALNTCGAES